MVADFEKGLNQNWHPNGYTRKVKLTAQITKT